LSQHSFDFEALGQSSLYGAVNSSQFSSDALLLGRVFFTNIIWKRFFTTPEETLRFKKKYLLQNVAIDYFY
jgi:hypothetical protein